MINRFKGVFTAVVIDKINNSKLVMYSAENLDDLECRVRQAGHHDNFGWGSREEALNNMIICEALSGVRRGIQIKEWNHE